MRDLGDGLVLRRATVEDTEALADFNARVHRWEGGADELITAWTRDLMSGRHPRMEAGDFTLVEDTRTSAIVSSLNLIPQTWAYAGVEFEVGQIELVGTHPDYRRRGLIRAQIEVVHRWSAERGHKVQAIDGIPWYYRQFGYEMALENGGGRVGYEANVPDLRDGELEPYRVRPAMEGDLAFIAEVFKRAVARYLVSPVLDEATWRYELLIRGGRRQAIRVVETPDGEPVGFLNHAPRVERGQLPVHRYELKPGVSWLCITPSVIRYLWKTGEEYAARDKKEDFSALFFQLGTEHPVYHAMKDRLPVTRRAYAWYLRVSDVADFVRHIAPVLEERLARSYAANHTGELRISFAGDGLQLSFDGGRLTRVERWLPARGDGLYGRNTRHALFPGLIFLQLLFGYRAVEDLEYAFPDCSARSDEVRGLLNILFPKRASSVWCVA